MKKAKRFLLIFFVVYSLGGFVAYYFWGPPDFSHGYMEEYRHDHERFRSIVSSEHYILYEENPEMNPLEGHFAHDAEFVEAYTARPAYLAERQRIDRYIAFFDYYNVLAVVVLGLGVGWAPLRGLLDQKIVQYRERLDTARATREAAQERAAAAESHLGALGSELTAVAASAAERAAEVSGQLETSTEQILHNLQQEIADRKVLVERRARMALRREVVDIALERVAVELTEHLTPEHQDALLQQFVHSLETRP